MYCNIQINSSPQTKNKRALVAGSDKSGDDVDERFSMSQLPNLTATQMVEALDDWDGVDNTLAVFQDLMIAESGIVHYYSVVIFLQVQLCVFI